MAGTHPRIIQGGMGIAVSNWRLASAVSSRGQLGTVSGTGIWVVLTRRLQNGDPGGHMRRALDAFPGRALADRIYANYYRTGDGRSDPFALTPLLTLSMRPDLAELLVVASFVEVWLAKQGHSGPVAINYLEKVQLGHLPSLYGAMLAGVDYVIMGAGVPIQIAEVLDDLAHHRPVSYRINVTGAAREDVFDASFDPTSIELDGERPPLRRPYFVPIVSLHVLATMLIKRSRGRIDGFIIENHTAGGHNAPPRNRKETAADGGPMYGVQDRADLGEIAALGLPFWLAGSHGTPASLRDALAVGATGIQVGSLFALCNESGLDPALRERAIAAALSDDGLTIRTSGHSSPSGFPFKEAQIEGTLSEPAVYAERRRVCDLGLLQTPYKREDGTLGYRCPAEPEKDFIRKGGAAEFTEGKVCLCNALTAAIGLGQRRTASNSIEPPILTLGDEHAFLSTLARPGGYTAAEALEFLESMKDEV